MFPALVIMFFVVVAFVAVLVMAQGDALKKGPRTQLGGPPVFEGTLTCVSENVVFGGPRRLNYSLTCYQDGEQMTSRCTFESKTWGAFRPVEIFIDKRGSKVEGRFPNGTTWNTVEGHLNDERGELTLGFPRFIPRESLHFQVRGGVLRLEKAWSFKTDLCELTIGEDEIHGQLFMNKSNSISVDVGGRALPKGLSVLVIILTAQALWAMFDD